MFHERWLQFLIWSCINAMVSDLAFDLEGSRCHIILDIQQLIELGALLANRALDNVEARQST
ncbi:hypothetical protein VP02_17015 [Pseudomonas ogarae]|uniref:Uncharacterized protein n=1 Tax=Pseudomonas kilonensis TaxID=132476 RepID=A0A0F4XKT8_9PSED|nr:hypothetical protein VP02_17015 [Pseudomonas ogarae]